MQKIELSKDRIKEHDGIKHELSEKNRFERIFSDIPFDVEGLEQIIQSILPPNQFKSKKYSDKITNEVNPLFNSVKYISASCQQTTLLIKYTGADDITGQPDGIILINGIEYKCEVTMAGVDEHSYLRIQVLKELGMVGTTCEIEKKGTVKRGLELSIGNIVPFVTDGDKNHPILDKLLLGWETKSKKLDKRDYLIIAFPSDLGSLIHKENFYDECEQFWNFLISTEEGRCFSKKTKRLIILLPQGNSENEIWDSYDLKPERIAAQKQIHEIQLIKENNQIILKKSAYNNHPPKNEIELIAQNEQAIKETCSRVEKRGGPQSSCKIKKIGRNGGKVIINDGELEVSFDGLAYGGFSRFFRVSGLYNEQKTNLIEDATYCFAKAWNMM